MTCYLPLVYAVELVLGMALIAALIWLPGGRWKANAIRQRDPRIVGLGELRRQAERELLSNSATFNAESREKEASSYLTKKIFAAIDYAIKRHDWYEDQRSRIFQATLTMLSVVLAVLAIGVKATDNLPAPYPFMLLEFAVCTAILLVRMLWLYSSELNADRPYRLVSDVVFWFFRYNLPEKSRGLGSRTDALPAAEAVLKERETFFRRSIANFPIVESMREDLEQLFILQILQRYKSESLIKLQWVLNYFLIFGSIQVVFLLIIRLYPF
jgi:hypothetical protein